MYPYRRIMVQDSGNICQCDITSHPTKNLWAGPTPCALSPGSWTTKHLWAGPTRRKKSCLLAPCACLLFVACVCLRLIFFSFYFWEFLAPRTGARFTTLGSFCKFICQVNSALDQQKVFSPAAAMWLSPYLKVIPIFIPF